MPSFCAVVGCGRRGNRDKNSFFRLPCIPKYGNRGTDSTLVNIKTKRRLKWILALRRKDLTETKLKYAVICDRHFISGRPAGNYDIENPDWVPSINMGYPTDPPKSTYKSPLIEYIKTSNVIQNESNNETDSNQFSSRDIENITDQNSNASEISERGGIVYQNTSSSSNYAPLQEETNSPEESISAENTLPEEYDIMRILNKNSANEDTDTNFSDGNAVDSDIFSEFTRNNSELYQIMPSKSVQTNLTMIDLDKISDAFKSSVIEVNQLKAKLKSLTEDILHLNELYC